MKRKRLAVILLCALVSAYLGAYILNSLGGGYRLVFVSSINNRIDYDASIEIKTNGGAIVWQPRYGNFTRLTSDPLGKIFYPLIYVDQTHWHRDIPASEIESRDWFKRRVSLRQVHPEDRKLYDARPLP